MGVKVKRKAAKNAKDTSVTECSVEAISEPPVKKQKVSSSEDFIQSLRGPNASEALKRWLYLISNKKEQAQMDKDLSSTSEETKQENSKQDIKEKELNEDEKNLSKDVKDIDSKAVNDDDQEEEFVEEDPTEDEYRNESAKHIDNFLSAGGSLSDIVYTLPSPENAHVSHLRTAFRVLTKILLRISADHQEKIPEAVETCRELLNSYLKHINDMLRIQRAPRERVYSLGLLTAMAALDTKFAREILNLISIEAEAVEHLSSMRVSLHTRVAYLKFLTALLIDADNSLVMSVVNRPWMLTSSMDGLQFDPSQIVVLLLMTMKKSILENMSVPKSAKQIIFNTDCIISLLHLYKWKGPANRPKSLTFWAMKKINDKPKLLAEIDKDEADQVADAVQELLIVLLTDYRCGIIFRDTSIAHQSDRHNKMVSRVLEKIGHPWENPKVSGLVSKVLAACPDSLRSTLTSMKPFIKPRSSSNWFNCVNFLKQVLENQRPGEILSRQLSWLTMMQLSGAAIEMCIPVSVLDALCSDDAEALCSDDAAVAIRTVELLVCMLKNISSFVDVVRKWASEKTLSYAQSTAFRRHVTEVLLKHVPKLSSIERAWQHWSDKYFEVGVVESADEVLVKPVDILSLLLELLEMYHRLCPAALDPLLSVQSDFKLAMSKAVLKSAGSGDTAQLRNRLYQLFLAINDQEFSTENSEMLEPIYLIVNDLISSCETVRSLAWSVLHSLIRRAGSLEGSPQEAMVWLSVFQETFLGKDDSCKEVANLFVESMMRACASCAKYFDVIARSEEGAAELLNENGISQFSVFDGAALQELLEDASETTETQHSSSYQIHLNAATLSPWLPAFLEVFGEHIAEKKMKKRSRKTAEEFCCKLIMRLMYRLPHPGSFLHMALKTFADVIPLQLSEYLQSWLPGGNLGNVQSSLLGENSVEQKLGSFLFFGTDDEDVSSQSKLQKLFVSLALPTVEDDLTENLSEVKRLAAMAQIVQVVYFISFHLTQLAQLQKLTEEFANRSQDMLLFISDIAAHFDKFTWKGKEQGLSFQVFKVLFCHPILFQQFNPLAKHNTESSTLLTKLVMALTKRASSCQGLENYLVPYKDKLILNLKTTVKKKRNPKGNVDAMVDAFDLQFGEILDLLSILSNLPLSSLVLGSGEESKLSQWTLLTGHLFRSASYLRNKGSSNISNVMILPPQVIVQVSNWISELLSNGSCDLTPLIEDFMLYIKSCPQQTRHITENLLPSILKSEQVSQTNGNLAEWIALCSPAKDISSAVKLSFKDKSSIKNRLPLILPVARVALTQEDKGIFKKSLLMSLYETIENEIQDSFVTLANHPDWLPSNVDVVVILMKRFMKPDVRKTLCKALEKKAPALTQEKQYYLQLVTEVLQTNPSQLLLLLLAWLGVSLKKYEISSNDYRLVQLLCETIKKMLNEEPHGDFSTIKSSKVWHETLRLALKLGLAPGKEEEEEEGRNNDPGVSCWLLETLHLLLKIMYSPEEDHEHINMVHSMTIQHSEFINIMMSSSPSKFALVQILNVLLEKNPKLMASSHVPVLLAAYNASLSKIDRALLRLLMQYEQSGIDLSKYRPYFWGRQGANHYSIWSQGFKDNKSLLQQPRPDQVLGLLDMNMVMKTIENFSADFTLNIQENESGFIDGIYDPSFCLPLFIYLLSPESPVITHMFMKSGALALTLASLSSNDVAVRAGAYTTLSRFISHLQMARGSGKDLLLHFMAALQKGVLTYGNQNPRLPSVVSVFLAQAALEIANPSSPLYRPLINFILAKPALNLHIVPEFLTLLHSDHVDHLTHRHWILQVLCDGIRAPIDIKLCLETAVFKLLLSFYTSCLSDFKSRLLILRSLRSAVGVQYGACRLIRDFSLASWLHQVILSLGMEDFTQITEMVRLLTVLWDSLALSTKGKRDTETGCLMPSVENPASKLLHLLLALHHKLSPQLGVDTLEQYFSVLSNVTNHLQPEDISVFSKEILMSLYEVVSPHCSNKRELCDLLELGCDCIDFNDGVIEKTDKLRVTLRKLTVQWIKGRNSPKKTDAAS